ncbi:hypothetical protein [Proteiniclasticum sp.]|uniref:hypothetical protein n=1 Tax=Proteiniclasticum sp. TaxID=2053595 RepID=UPI0037CB2EC9
MTSKEKEEFLKDDSLGTYRNELEENGTGVILYSPEMGRMQLEVYAALLRMGMTPVKIEVMEPTMENLFLEVVR